MGVSKSIIFVILLLLCYAQCKDYYQILNVSKSAKPKEIKKAYFQLVKKYHPDKNPGNKEAEEKFREVTAIYDVLMDEEKRRVYDQYGEEGLKQSSQGSQSSWTDPFGGFDFGFGGFGGFGGSGKSSRSSSFFSFESFFNDDVEEPVAKKAESLSVPLHVSHAELKAKKLLRFLRVMLTKKSTSRKRQCNCRMETHTQSLGPGSFRMSQKQVCDECPVFDYVMKEIPLTISLDPSYKKGKTAGNFFGYGEVDDDLENGDLSFIIANIHS